MYFYGSVTKFKFHQDVHPYTKHGENHTFEPIFENRFGGLRSPVIENLRGVIPPPLVAP